MELGPLRSNVERMVRSYIDATVEIVPSVDEWCALFLPGVHFPEWHTSPIARAIWRCPNEPNRILLQSSLHVSSFTDRLLALRMSNLSRAEFPIHDEWTYVKHLVLHEVAHVKHNWDQTHERECDEWAFEELPKWSET